MGRTDDGLDVDAEKTQYSQASTGCHCSFTAVCGGTPRVAVNGNTVKQGTSVRGLSWALREGGATVGFDCMFMSRHQKAGHKDS